MTLHLANQIKNHELESSNALHVIGVIQNAVRYHSRYRLFHEWAKEMCATPNVKLHVVEATYGDRLPECSNGVLNYNYHQVKTSSEVWLKENLINIGVKNLLPRDWKYMAWVDCDVHFRNPNWALQTIHQLQHYNILQPWSDAVDLDFHGGIHSHFKSFGSLHANKKPKSHYKNNPYNHPYGHSGFAWACNRYFYENVEKLLDFCIVGAGDHHMAWACIGEIEGTIHKKIGHNYIHLCKEWQRRAKLACAGLVGYVHGRIEHNFHGPKERRQYWNRWQILLDNHYDPINDLRYDSQGVLHVVGKPNLEHEIMLYNRQRMEDSIEQY